jgi:chemotaxis family two-component system response regulator Rcp1
MRHILHVEDNEGDVRLVREALQTSANDYQVIVARDGVEASECLHGRGSLAGAALPELILLDLNLPKKSGCEVLEEIKSDAELRHIPVIVFTSSAASADVLKAYGLHANCYLTKPTDIEELFRIIQILESFWFDTVKLPLKPE